MKKVTLGLFLFAIIATGTLYSLADGDYLYEFTRITDFPDLEQLYREQGMHYRTVTVETVRGMVVTVSGGMFADPSLTGFRLAVDKSGVITSTDGEITEGQLSKSGALAFTGVRDHYGQRARMAVTGTLTPLSPKEKADSRLDGVYLLEEELNGKKMAARIENGYLTFEEMEGEQPRTSGWPTLVRPDGTISSVFEFITRSEINDMAGDSSTFFTVEGKAAPGSLSLTFIDSTATTADTPGTASRRVYGGQKLQEADFGALAADTSRSTEPQRVPDWFLNPGNGPEWITASGSKRYAGREAALKAAETAAAANLALQLQTRIKSSLTLWSRVEKTETDEKTLQRMESATAQIAFLPLKITVLRMEYDEKTQTAWVMVGITTEDAETAVRNSFLESLPAETVNALLDGAF